MAKPPQQPTTSFLLPQLGFFGRAKESIIGSELFRSLPLNFERTGDPKFEIRFDEAGKFDKGKTRIQTGFRFATKKQLEREAQRRQVGRDISFFRTRGQQTEGIFQEFEATEIVPTRAEARGIKVTTEIFDDKTITTLSDPKLESRIKEVEARTLRQEADVTLNQGLFSLADEALRETSKRGQTKKIQALAGTTAGQSLLILEQISSRQKRAKFIVSSDFVVDKLEKSLIRAEVTGQVVGDISEAKRERSTQRQQPQAQKIAFIEDPIGATGQKIATTFKDRPRTIKSAVARRVSKRALETREIVTLPRAFRREFEQKPVSRGALFTGVAAVTGGVTFLGSTTTGVAFTQSATGQTLGSVVGFGVTGSFLGSRGQRILKSQRGRARTQAIAETAADITVIGAGAVAGAKLGRFGIAKFEEAKLRFALRQQNLELKTLTTAIEGGHPSTKSISRIPREFQKSKFKLPRESKALQPRRGFHATTALPKFEGTRIIKSKFGTKIEKIFSIQAAKSTLPTGEPRLSGLN